MTVRTLTNATDTYAAKANPARTHSTQTVLVLSPSDHSVFVYFSLPFAKGATIVRATLEMWTSATSYKARTVRASMVDTKQTYSSLNWNNRPGFVAPHNSQSSSSGAIQKWTFDVTAHMQAVSDGQFWWGFRLNQTAGTDGLRFYSAQSSSAERRPKLIVEWADEPDEPSDLVPFGGLAVSKDKPVLRFVYADYGGNTSLAGARVQIASNAAFTAGLWDSGPRPITVPEFDLADPEISNYPGLPAGGSLRYWRIMVKDGADLWSGWSLPATMRFVDRSALTVTHPAGDVIMDSTPIVAWTFAGTQVQWQVQVYEDVYGGRTVHNTGRRTGTETSYEVPTGVMRDDRRYLFTVRVWDDVERASTPGAPAYRQASQSAIFDEDAAVIRPSGATASQIGDSPRVAVEWVGPEDDPDSFQLIRDGVILGQWHPDEVRLEPGVKRYRYIDRTAPPMVPVRYDVRSLTDRRRSTARPTMLHHTVQGVWLTTDTETVCLSGKEAGSPTLGQRSTVHEVGDRVVVITDALRGHEGEWSGQLHSDISICPGVSAKEHRDALMRIRENPVGVRLHMGPVNVPVVLSEINVRATPDPELAYDVSFNYWQERGPELDALESNG